MPHLADLDPGRGGTQIHLVEAPDPPDRGADVVAYRGDGALTGVLPQGMARTAFCVSEMTLDWRYAAVTAAGGAVSA